MPSRRYLHVLAKGVNWSLTQCDKFSAAVLHLGTIIRKGLFSLCLETFEMSQREQTPMYYFSIFDWVKDQLKPLVNTCKYRLQNTNDVIFCLNSLNQKYAPFPLVCY